MSGSGAAAALAAPADAVDGPAMRAWTQLALHALGAARAEIDALNVFPVADGDTGTNLYLTLEAAATAAAALPDDADLAATVRTVARGALIGARGNSGGILSQLLRGIARTLADEEARATPWANADLLAEALRCAADSAYDAVVTPVEGTMLSVARAAAEAAAAEPVRAVEPVVVAAARGAREALARTPTQLEPLARAGVVDAGGQGLVVLLDALVAVVTRTPLPPRATAPAAAPLPHEPGTDGEFEVMYLLDATDEAVDALRPSLAALGESVVVVGGEGLWSVHVHTDDAGAAVEAGIAAGRPHRIRVSALRTPAASAARRVVAVLVAEPAVAELVAAAGALPLAATADDVLRAVRGAHAREAVVVAGPDGRPAAEVAVRALSRDGVRASLVPLEHDLQALAAVAVAAPEQPLEEDAAAMRAAAGAMRCRRVAPDRLDAELDGLLAGGGELVTVLAPEQRAAAVESALRAARPALEVVVHAVGAASDLLVGVE
ncbi:hypothetical protein EV189_2429 [Motilibacter rhizosphaerae]|uniref:DhaL domain-containing protein n=1 Tax=Motilibacter rhizosphaerae TaxID=598652 RepID=A0A4Q7NQX5_9ACTN|nr:DAK2 domain-containing protein [Motilibacter rhizosphaerae]RZS87010.1 hypothetical protein EV189_2429 [Motilibacter rhizosphaerae]